MNQPQIVRIGGATGGPPTQSPPKGKVTLLEPDLKLCQEMLMAGIPEETVVDVASALNQKLQIIDENARLVKQNADLLEANQRLAGRVEHYESEVRRLKRGSQFLEEALALTEEDA